MASVSSQCLNHAGVAPYMLEWVDTPIRIYIMNSDYKI